ncbi:Deleted in lung and esophageal cancer protein 1 [Phytophthora boehmeriae]|uniref:Deleted in lung and esophageal cancer protein 1 n=1 Tax=Phytophthora boehmeriae TaxID=109152 RepID=A0A8T1X6E6_9STRA|nr:Deleted in lung and esophageal cancer protein 1 [Phytophthora boehmeriae]
MTAILFAKIGHSSEGLKTLTTILKRRTLDNMAVPATGKKASDAAAAAATLEAAQAAERLEREAADAAAAADVLKAQQEAEEEAARLQKQQAEDELDIVAVGAVAHVIRRAFRSFYEPEEPTPVNTGRSEAADEQAAVGDAASESESQVEAEGDAKEQEQVQTDTQEVAADTGRKEQWTARDEMLQREESPFVAIAQARKDAIAAELAKKHEQARALLKFMEQRQQDAAEADARIANELNQKGLVIKAQIPVGPTSLRLDEQELRAAAEAGNDFGEFADSLLHAKTLVAEYEKTRLERSGNVAKAWSPSRRTAAGEGSSEAGDHVGYLNTTSSSNIRKDATLKYHKNNIASVKSKHEEYRAANTTTDTIPGDEIAHEVEQDEENIFPPVTTTPSLLPETQQEQPQRPELVMKAVEKRKNMAILDRMQTKLDFMRNPRFAAPEQMQATKSKPSKDHGSTGIQSNGVTPICFDVIPKPPIMFTDYDIGGLYEQVVYVRNRSDLSRRIRILPPGTTFFSMARILYPEASGMIAPGLNVELRIRFAPDSRADYKDSFTVQFETEQIGSGTPGSAGSGEIVVPLMGRREPPELTLPLVVHAQNTLVGGRSTTPLMCTNLGGKARFWLMSEHAWSQLEYLQVVCPGTSSVRSAVGLLGSDQQQRASLEVGPFHLTPNEIELDKGESVTFDLVYTPTGVGEQRERFVMVCDNCLVRVFQVVGRGCQVDIAATRVNDSPIDTNVAEMGPLDHMIFPNEILVNGQAQQTIVITNDTPLDVKYTWKIHPLLLDPRDKMNEGGKDKVTMLPVPPDWRPPFRVVPDSGVFALSSSKEFTVEFLPTESRTYECQVTLMINDIPACSMPGPGQMEHLKAAFKGILCNFTDVEGLAVLRSHLNSVIHGYQSKMTTRNNQEPPAAKLSKCYCKSVDIQPV